MGTALYVCSGIAPSTSPTDRCLDPLASVPRLDSPGGGSGLLVDEELARAVRHEAAAAVMF